MPSLTDTSFLAREEARFWHQMALYSPGGQDLGHTGQLGVVWGRCRVDAIRQITLLGLEWPPENKKPCRDTVGATYRLSLGLENKIHPVENLEILYTPRRTKFGERGHPQKPWNLPRLASLPCQTTIEWFPHRTPHNWSIQTTSGLKGQSFTVCLFVTHVPRRVGAPVGHLECWLGWCPGEGCQEGVAHQSGGWHVNGTRRKKKKMAAKQFRIIRVRIYLITLPGLSVGLSNVTVRESPALMTASVDFCPFPATLPFR